jgi:hypothetical protein
MNNNNLHHFNKSQKEKKADQEPATIPAVGDLQQHPKTRRATGLKGLLR